MTGIPRRLLGEDEGVVMALRPHWKELVAPTLVLLIVCPLATYAATVSPEGSAQTPLRIAILVIALLLLARFTVWPFLRWLTTSYIVTDRRVITRVGIVARHGRDMPLSRINDVSFEHSGVLERMLGCGTLTVESAGERGQLVMRDVPGVEEVQRDVYRLAEEDEERRRGEREHAPDSDDDHRGW
ncbi:MAG: PH domain-containing protein [Actinomycetes bacterium]